MRFSGHGAPGCTGSSPALRGANLQLQGTPNLLETTSDDGEELVHRRVRRAPERPGGVRPNLPRRCARAAARRVEWRGGGRAAPMGVRGWQRPGADLSASFALHDSSSIRSAAHLPPVALLGSHKLWVPVAASVYLADELDPGSRPDDV